MAICRRSIWLCADLVAFTISCRNFQKISEHFPYLLQIISTSLAVSLTDFLMQTVLQVLLRAYLSDRLEVSSAFWMIDGSRHTLCYSFD